VGETIRIIVNGRVEDVPRGITVAGLCELLGVDRARIAVERNRDVIPRAAHHEVILVAGDSLELVSFVGGG
jgi:thiamine biosynthesis protein ThiS